MLCWKKNKLKYNHRLLKFESNIINAGKFCKWIVVATSSKIHFLGDDECVIPFDILRIEIQEKVFFFQNSTNMNIYKLTHPYQQEEFLFSSPSYLLRYAINNDLFILEKEGSYTIRYKDKVYYFILYTENDSVVYLLEEMNDSKFQYVKVNSLDDKITHLNVNLNFSLYVYNGIILLIFENSITFVKFTNSCFEIGKPVYVSQKIRIVKILEMNSREKIYYFLQVNNTIFYNTDFVCVVGQEGREPPKQNKKCKFVKEIAFWNKKSDLEDKLLSLVNEKELVFTVKNRIQYLKYIFNFNTNISALDLALETEYHESKNFETFFKKIKENIFSQKSVFMKKVLKITRQTFEICNSKNLEDLLKINYKRLFYFNSKLITKSSIKNLAYRIIYYEENRQKIFKPFRKCEYSRFFKKHFKDNRMIEVFNLFNEKIKTFELDENDAEEKTEWNYVIRNSCNIGKSYCFFSNNFSFSNISLSKLVEPELRFLIRKCGDIDDIKLKDKYWKDWPSFNLGCASILTTKKNTNFKKLMKIHPKSNFYLAGMIFGLGIKNKFRNIDFSNFIELIQTENVIVTASLLYSYGISNKNMRNLEFEKYCFNLLQQDTSLLVRAGVFGGMSNIFRNMKNWTLKNILEEEINKEGTYISDNYNKSNIIVYDKTYKIMISFNLAKVLGKSKEYITIKNKLCELIVNGLCIYDKGKYKMNLERCKRSPLDEYFYSNLFLEEIHNFNNNDTRILSEDSSNINLAKYEIRLSEVKDNFMHFDTWDIYKYAGILFYYGANFTFAIKNSYIDLLESIEKGINRRKELRVLFDFLLITVCIFTNSQCNLDLIRIIRKLIKQTEISKNMNAEIIYKFTNFCVSRESFDNLTYGDCEKYKMCLGIATLGLCKYGIVRTKDTPLDLISTFYVNWPVYSYEQEGYTFYRYNLFNSITKISTTMSMCKKYFVQKLFKKEFSKLEDSDKKYVIDVLSDYYESYHKQNNYLIDIKYFKDLVIRSK